MKKHLILTTLACLTLMFFASCGKPNKLVGTWVEPKEEGSSFDEQGFTLLEDGGIICINMGYYDYQTWEKVDEQLIVKGTYTGSNPHDFCDTLNIVRVTDEELVLEQGGYEITYVKR